MIKRTRMPSGALCFAQCAAGGQSRRASYDGSCKAKWRDMTVATEMEKARMGSTHCLDESPVLEESRLILDIIARDPCLDLISESL